MKVLFEQSLLRNREREKEKRKMLRFEPTTI